MLYEVLEKLISEHGEIKSCCIGIYDDWAWTLHEDLSLNRLELGKNGWENTIEYTVDESSLNNSYLTMIGLCKQRYGLTEDTPYNACIDRIIEDLENMEEAHLRDSSRDI